MSSDEGSREAALESADALVFLCSGNMVRSAFADLYAQHIGFDLPVLSGATTYRNDRLFPETARALAALGIAKSTLRAFRPTHIDDLVPRLADRGLRRPVFFAMRHHHRVAMSPWPALMERTFLLDPEREIEDPVLEGADFAETFNSVAAAVDELKRWFERPSRPLVR